MHAWCRGIPPFVRSASSCLLGQAAPATVHSYAPSSFPDCTIHKLLARLSQLCHNTPEHHENMTTIYPTVVLGEVVLVDCHQFPLNLADHLGSLILYPRCNALSYTANNQVIAVSIQ